jgi:alcohol dehydrogenase class IV
LTENNTLHAIIEQLHAAGVTAQILCTQTAEPTVQDVDRVTAELRQQVDRLRHVTGHWLLAIGGGSALDLAKAVAAMLTNAHGASVAEFLEGIGTGRTIDVAPLQVAAMPTTAGTGSEATKNAVISSPASLAKKSLRSPLMIPPLVLVDPELTGTLSAKITAWTGMDALTQLIESYLTRKAQPTTRALALGALDGFVPALRAAVQPGEQRAAREHLAHAALTSGICLANSGLGMAHGVAAALGALCNVPHGLACAVMLTPTLRANAEGREDDYVNLARALTGRTDLKPKQAVKLVIDTVQELADEIGIPRKLRDIGVEPAQIPELVRGSAGNSMNGNPRTIDDAELTTILEKLW